MPMCLSEFWEESPQGTFLYRNWQKRVNDNLAIWCKKPEKQTLTKFGRFYWKAEDTFYFYDGITKKRKQVTNTSPFIFVHFRLKSYWMFTYTLYFEFKFLFADIYFWLWLNSEWKKMNWKELVKSNIFLISKQLYVEKFYIIRALNFLTSTIK